MKKDVELYNHLFFDLGLAYQTLPGKVCHEFFPWENIFDFHHKENDEEGAELLLSR